MATVDVKYDTTPHDGTPGPPWDDFEERILGVAAGRTDDRGYSLADCANQTDEGGVGGNASKSCTRCCTNTSWMRTTERTCTRTTSKTAMAHSNTSSP